MRTAHTVAETIDTSLRTTGLFGACGGTHGLTKLQLCPFEGTEDRCCPEELHCAPHPHSFRDGHASTCLAMSTNSASDLLWPSASFSHTLLPTWRLIVAMSSAQRKRRHHHILSTCATSFSMASFAEALFALSIPAIMLATFILTFGGFINCFELDGCDEFFILHRRSCLNRCSQVYCESVILKAVDCAVH